MRLAAITPARIAHPATRELMSKIELALDPELDAAFPKQRAARVAIDTYEGRTAQLLQPTRKGDPDAPLSDAELGEKFLELAAPVIGAPPAQALLARLWALERESTLDLLCRPRS